MFKSLKVVIVSIMYSHRWKHARVETIPHTRVNWIIKPQVTLMITQK